MTSKAFKNVQKLNDIISVRQFGATCDGTTDDTAAVQAALNYISTNGGTLQLEGICAISSTLNVLAGEKWILRGSGGPADGALKALVAMDWMINIGNSNAFEGQVQIRDIVFRGNALSGGINCHNLRYARLENLWFSELAATKTAIKIGNWVNRVTNCTVSGASIPEIAVHVFSPDVSYSNNFVIDKNAFTAQFGIYIEPGQYTNQCVIRDNSLDLCPKAAIYNYGFSRGLVITGNYIEGCGGTAVSVEKTSGVFENRYGAIILAHPFNIGVLGWSGLSIYDNQFNGAAQTAPVGKRVCIDIDFPTDTHIYGNNIYPAGTYDAFIMLSGSGCSYSSVYKFKVEHADPENKLSELIKNNVTIEPFASPSGYGNFSAKFINEEGSQQFPTPDIFANFASWTTVGSITVTDSYSGGIRNTNFNNSGGAYIQYELTDAVMLKMFINKYFRFSGIGYPVSPGSPADNNLQVIVAINTGSGYFNVMDLARTDTTPTRFSLGQVFFVPPATTGIRIRLKPTVNGEVNVRDIRFFDTAALP